MNSRRLLLIVIAIIFLCNFVLLLLVQKDGEWLSLSAAITIAEIVLLSVVIWYWVRHYRIKDTHAIHKLL